MKRTIVKNIKDIVMDQDLWTIKSFELNQHLRQSIKMFGQLNPIKISQGNELMDGYKRLLILKSLGIEKVSVTVENSTFIQKEKSIEEITQLRVA